jgi:hypothetical protein
MVFYAVAQSLRLDYMRLKKRLGGVASRRKGKAKPIFVELIAPPPTRGEECRIEFESTRGDEIRIHWPVRAAPDWTAVVALAKPEAFDTLGSRGKRKRHSSAPSHPTGHAGQHRAVRRVKRLW